MLDFQLLEMEDARAERVSKRWSKEGKKLRRALEPIRDADVYLARLHDLRDRPGRQPGDEPKLSLRCLRDIDAVEGLLKQQRQRGADELAEVLDAFSKRLTRLTRELEVALTPERRAKVHSPAQEALTVFAGLSSEFAPLDSTNLHAYRKRLKGALYLSALSAASDPLAGRLAVAFEKIHGAIGEWHDWHSLAEEADRILPKSAGPNHARNDGLVSVLKARAEEALQKALVLCRGSAAQLLERPGLVRPSPRRKPVVSESAGVAVDEERYLGISR
jgi:hypothetical protein